MKIVQETTKWEGGIPNHIYVLDDSMSKLIGYVPLGTKEVKKFAKPLSFSTKGREFKLMKQMDEPNPNVKYVEGSKGKRYTLTREDGVWVKCSCDGFKYRGSCKHIEGEK